MRDTGYIRTMTTACGKTITYYKEDGCNAKAHSTSGPAITYPKSDKKSPEYYLYGVKYTKTQWQELVNQNKVSNTAETAGFEY